MAKEIPALNYPLTLVQGETFISQYQRQIEVNGVTSDVDITNATITGAIKGDYSDTTNLATFTVTKITPATGVFRVTLPAATSAALPSGSLKYEVRATWTTGQVETFFRGNLLMVAGIA